MDMEVSSFDRFLAISKVPHHILTFLEAANFKGEAYVLTHEFDESCPKTSTDPFISAFNAETWEAKDFVHGLGKSNATAEQIEEYQNKIAGWLMK